MRAASVLCVFVLALAPAAAFLSEAELAQLTAKLVARGNATSVTNENLLGDLTALSSIMGSRLAVLNTCLDYLWLLICGALVMFMQAGFAILETGACRAKNAGVLLMKNAMDICVGTMMWWLLGFGFAYGVSDSPNPFIGTASFAGHSYLTVAADGATLTGTSELNNWFFQWAFCATAATIVSGAVAERIQFGAYVVFSMVMTAFIYPTVVYWTWCSEGWLYKMGYSDFAGSGIVHMVGGIGALVGAWWLGPRDGRWKPGIPETKFQPHNMGLVVLGTIILWFGWYGFNCGSTLSFHDVNAATKASLVAMNSTIAAAAGGLVVVSLRYWRNKHRLDLAGMCNGILAGLVAVCAGVGGQKPEMAFVTGCLGGLAQELGHEVMIKLKIDDPLDAFAVHGCGGLTGVLTAPLFAWTGANGRTFGVHCLAAVSIIAWTAVLSTLIFGSMYFLDKLRVSTQEEEEGGDKGVMYQEEFYKTTSIQVEKNSSKMSIQVEKNSSKM